MLKVISIVLVVVAFIFFIPFLRRLWKVEWIRENRFIEIIGIICASAWQIIVGVIFMGVAIFRLIWKGVSKGKPVLVSV